MMKVTTESGTVYEFTKDKTRFRRLRNRNEIDPEAEVERAKLRRDGQWLRLFRPAGPVIGFPMVLTVEPLDDSAYVTMHHTSVVVGVEE